MDWSGLATALGSRFADVLMTIIASVLVAVAVQYARKLGIEISDDKQAQLEKDVLAASLRREELRANGTLSDDVDPVLWVAEQVQKKWPSKATGIIADILHAQLPLTPFGAAAKAMQEAAQKATAKAAAAVAEVAGGSPR